MKKFEVSVVKGGSAKRHRACKILEALGARLNEP